LKSTRGCFGLQGEEFGKKWIKIQALNSYDKINYLLLLRKESLEIKEINVRDTRMYP
jgi:hypothetical protein